MKEIMTTPNPEPASGPSNFIRDIILDDLKTNKYQGRVHTRFPPEPNGYLHIGHAKSICLNFGLAAEFGGKTNLRFDDTNPSKEETEYVDSIIDSVRWLGFDWEDRLFYASDYFHQLYDWALQMIREGKAFVCDLTADEIRQYRGTPTEPGKYQVALFCKQTGATLETSFHVQGVAAERLGRAARPEVLEEIARVTRGKTIEAAKIDEVVRSLAELPDPPAAVRRVQLWSHPVPAVMIVTLLGIFWVGRKMIGLV